MADNVQLNSGTGGDIAAADDIGGVKFQRVKCVLGADGTNDGDISKTNPMPSREVTPNADTDVADGCAVHRRGDSDCADRRARLQSERRRDHL